MALKSTTVAMKDVVSGSMICTRMRTWPAPSICAASQMESFTDSMPFLSMMMLIALQQAGMIIEPIVLVSPSARTTIYSGMMPPLKSIVMMIKSISDR